MANRVPCSANWRWRSEAFERGVISAAIIASTIVFPGILFAIPSPDVLINVFASAGQVLGMISVVFGATLFGKRRFKSAAGGSASKFTRIAFGGSLLLLILSLAANVLQYTSILDSQARRVYTNLTRPSIERGKGVGDTNLRTLSRSQQLTHPGALTADAFNKLWRFQGFEKRYMFIDVRNPEEFEMGQIAGTRNIPQPDLRVQRNEIFASGKPIILVCESGNRSGELCTDLHAEGHSCQFIIGGYEKWIDENRPMRGRRSGGGFRDIMPYPNKEVLLDTPDVEELVLRQGAVFVDVRYPGDFDLYHLPNAINIPIRKLPTPEMLEALRAIPDKPVIAPCYDKRSCFYAMILGLRLHRLDRDFRGRYTVPHEYVAPDPENDFLQRWQTRNERTLISFLQRPLDQLLGWADEKTGNFPLGICLFVMIMRILFFPFGAKSERDQFVLQRSQVELDQLRAHAGKSASQESRLIFTWYRKNRIRPALNLCGSLLQLFVFIICFAAVGAKAGEVTGSFLWAESPSTKDPLLILPALVGLLAYLQISASAKRKARIYQLLRLLCATVFILVTIEINIALNFYLVLSLLALVLQSLAVRAFLTLQQARSSRTTEKHLQRAAIVPLSEAHRTADTGNKAARLGVLCENGFSVPRGLVITSHAFVATNGTPHLAPEHQEKLSALLRSFRKPTLAVRSSGLDEDGAERSFAGVFESLLNVERENLPAALEHVRASLSSERAKAYAGEAHGLGGIVVQEMVDAEYAGVLFTEHPAESGTCLVELVSGLGDALVSGTTDAEAYRFGKVSGMLLASSSPPIPLFPLVELGRRLEKLFGSPQDIEWAYRDGKFFLLQARNITKLSRSLVPGDTDRMLVEQERCRLLENVSEADICDFVYEQDELSELLPSPTPLSLSLMRRIWGAGGSADLACISLGIPYEIGETARPLFTTVFGKLYVNRIEERSRLRRPIGIFAAYNLTRAATAIEAEYREEFLPGYLSEMQTLAALDVTRFEISELWDVLRFWLDHFVSVSYLRAERINVAADFYLRLAEKQLLKRDLNVAAHLSGSQSTATYQALSLLPEIRAQKHPVSDFMKLYGHRATYDFELSEPRYAEKPELVEQLVQRSSGNERGVDRDTASLPPGRMLRIAVERARTFQALKEDAKHYAAHELFLIRRLILEIGARWGIGGDIFLLEFDEILQRQLPETAAGDRAVIAKRKQEQQLFRRVTLPSKITLTQLESLEIGSTTAIQVAAAIEGGLSGKLVSGSTVVEGNARVITDIQELDEFLPGEILVARFTNPEYTPLFVRAGGVVTEVGGWLSHAAILAREFNLTTIVGVPCALDQIRTGDRIRLCLDGRVEHI